MNKIIPIALLIVVLQNNAIGQTRSETAVTNAVEKLRIAMMDGNRAELEAIADDQLSYGHSGGKVESKKDFVEKIASGSSDFVTIDLTEQTISINGKTAIVRHMLVAKTNDGGKPGEVHLKVLLVWQKKAGKWKLLARQAVKMT